jgi:predicted amidohydrolase YtcJ
LIIAIKHRARRDLRCHSRNIFEMSAAERTVLAAYLLCLFGCSSVHESGPTEIADHVFINGGVYTLNPAEPWAQAVAIVEKRVHMVGGNAEVEKLIGPQTVVIDLKNRMLMPSFGDSHIHLLFGGDSISRCDLNYVEASAEIRRILLQCAETLNVSEGDWLIATDWARSAFPESIPPP